MSLDDVIKQLNANNIQIALADDNEQLTITAAKGAMTRELMQLLKDNKSKLLAFAQQKARQTPRIIPPRQHHQPVPLSSSQQRLWFIEQLAPGQLTYQVPLCVKIKGKLDLSCLEDSLTFLCKRHESLSTAFIHKDGMAKQWIDTEATLAIDTDHPELPNDDDQLMAYLINLINQPFDLAIAPLMRAHLIPLAEDTEQLLLINLHHLITDGWSNQILLHELGVVYEAFSQGKTPILPTIKIQYADYAEWQQQNLAQNNDKGLSFWRRQLENAEVLNLPTDRPAKQTKTGHGQCYQWQLDTQLHNALAALAKANQCTDFTLYLTAFQIFLHKLSGQTDIVIGTPTANRQQPEIQNTVGFFVNTLALRTGIDSASNFTAHLQKNQSLMLAISDHQDIPFDTIVESLGIRRDRSATPLFQVMLSYQKQTPPLLQHDLQIEPVVLDTGTAKFDLTLGVDDQGDTCHLSLEYDADLFDASTIKRLADYFTSLLRHILSRPEAPVHSLLLMNPQQQADVLNFAAGHSITPTHDCIATRFSAIANRFADKPAIRVNGESLSYLELDQQAAQFAHYLRKLGFTKQDALLIALPRGFDMLVCIMACYKAGGYYIPLDPDYPETRQDAIILDANPRLLITDVQRHERLQERLQTKFEPSRLLSIKHIHRAAKSLSQHIDPVISVATDTAYMIYTSGSTGKPKGVKIPHSGVLRLADDTTAFDFSPNQRISHLSNVAFDASIWEIFGTLLNGATLIAIDSDTRLDCNKLAQVFLDEQVTTCLFTVPLFNMIADINPQCFKQVDYIGIGGEALDANTLQKVQTASAPIKLVNIYGPTENTCVSCFHPITQADIDRGRIPLGRPVANSFCYIVDSQLNLCPFTVEGQLAVSGPGVASGYHNLPEKTAESFVPNPFQGQTDTNSVLYLTGDQCSLTPNGTFAFSGRQDDQIKLRGYRIELADIIHQITACDSVLDATVIVKGEQSAAYLAAFIVPTEPSGNDLLTTVRNQLLLSLPHYMVPSAYALIEKMPVTANGKVDKAVLGDADFLDNFLDNQAFKAPETLLEKTIAEHWQNVLETNQPLSIHDDFFNLGGHSLLATRVIASLRETLLLDLTLKDLFDYPSIELLASRLQSLANTGKTIAPLSGSQRPENLPLSFAQQRLWFIDKLNPGSLYHMPFALKIEGPLDIMALEFAFDALIMRHESLRTRFITLDDADVPYQWIDENSTFSLQSESFSGVESDLLQPIQDFIEAPFDLSTGPLIRAKLLTQEKSHEHYLLLCLHHIIADGWSIEIAMRDLFAFYQSIRTGEDPGLPELPLQYADCMLRQNEHLQQTQKEQWMYWQSQLSNCPRLGLLTDFARPAQLDHSGSEWRFTLSQALSNQLRRFSQAQGATLFMTLLSAFNLLLSRYSQQQDFAIGTPITNRSDEASTQNIGLFLNTLVLRNPMQPDDPFVDFLQQVKANTAEAFKHQAFPFDKLVEELGGQRDISQTPIFQVMIIYQTVADTANQSLLQGNMGDLTLSAIAGTERAQSAKFDVTLNIIDLGDQLEMALEYRTALFRESTIKRLSTHFEQLLISILAAPETPLSRLSLITQEEETYLLTSKPGAGPNATSTHENTAPENKTTAIHTIIENQCKKTPAAIAITDVEGNLTYQQLNEAANRLAQALLNLPERPQAIGLCLHRSRFMSIGILAIIKAGSCYVPIDPDLPDERLAIIVDDCKLTLILSDEATSFNVPDNCQRWSIDTQSTDPDALANPTITLAPDALINIIYTSGSTGLPKGVMVTHRGILNRLQWMQTTYKLSASDNVLQKTPFTFDVSVWELLWPLMQGATLVFAKKDGHKDPYYLRQLIIEQAITHVHFVPSMLQVFLQQGQLQAIRTLKQIFASGEALPAKTVTDTLKQLPHTKLDNLYGPTEASIDVTWYPCLDSHPFRVPIGQPIANTQILILDAHQQLCPIGLVGELYIGGTNLALGYINRDAMTAQSFIDNPFDKLNGSKLYKTADLGRYNEAGQIEYFGRNDSQVKIRGQRIELGDIENNMRRIEGIEEVAVVVHHQDDDQLLVAYYSGDTLSASHLQKALKTRLPGYMLPDIWQPIDAMPLTDNGKIDRRALPDLSTVRQTDFVAPETTTQITLCRLFAAILDSDPANEQPLSIDADFFLSGGHSLKAIRLVAQIESELDIHLAVSDIFLYPTVRSLGDFIDSRDIHQQPLPAIIPINTDQPVPASFNQQRLWLFQHMHPQSTAYHMPLAFTISGVIDQALFTEVFRRLIDRHSILRTRLFEQDGTLMQAVMPDSDVNLIYENATDVQAANTQMAALLSQPFDLKNSSAIRIGLIHYRHDKALLVILLHHIIADASSLSIVLHELLQLMTALSSNQSPQLAAPVLQYRDFAYWQQQQASIVENQLDYWQQTLANLPSQRSLLACLRHDTPQENLDATAGILNRSLDTELLTSLRQFCQHHKITPFMLLLGNLQILLAKISQQSDICIGVPVSGRHHQGLEQLIGFFVNTLLLRQNLDISMTCHDFLNSVKAQVIHAFAHQDVALEQVMARLDTRFDGHELPTSIGFNYFSHHPVSTTIALENLTITALDIPTQEAKYDMIVACQDTDSNLEFTIEYNRSMYQDNKVAAFFDAYLKVLNDLITSPIDTRLHTIQPLDEADLLPCFIDSHPDIEQVLPLTPIQRDIFIDSQIAADNPRNYLGWIQHLPISADALDIDHLQKALALTIKDHAALRMRIVDTNKLFADSLYQLILPPAIAIEQSPLTMIRLDASDRQSLIDFCQTRVYQAYKPSAPLFEWVLIIDNADRAALLLRAHHACLDGISLKTVTECYSHYYECLTGHHETKHLSFSDKDNYAEYIKNAGQYNSSKSLAYWRTALYGFSQLNPPRGLKPGPFQQMQLDDDSSHFAAVQHYCKTQKTTVSLYFKALYAILLNSYCHADNDFYFHEVIAARPAGHHQTTGCYFSSLPVCLPLKTVNTGQFTALLAHLRQQQKNNRPYQSVSNQLLNQCLDASDCQFFYNFYTLPHSLPFADKTSTLTFIPPIMDKAVNLTIHRVDDHLRFNLDFPSAYFVDHDFLPRLIHLSKQILLGQPLLHELSLRLPHETIKPDEKRQVFPANAVIALLQPALSRFSEQIAVSDHLTTLSFGQLDQQSNQMAHKLKGMRLKKAAPVGLAIEPGCGYMVALLAILKAGHSYVALDKHAPEERLQHIMADANLACTITDEPERLPTNGCYLDSRAPLLEANDPISVTTALNDPFYTIYTSGSTGRAKGVTITQRNAINLLLWYQQQFAINDQDRILIISATAFDLTQKNLFVSILTGARLHFCDMRHYDADRIIETIAQQQITLINAAPSACYPWLTAEQPLARLASLRLLLMGGEPIHSNKIQHWFSNSANQAELVNMYGPSECTDIATYYRLDNTKPLPASIPIGQHAAHVTLYTLDPAGRLLPDGLAGEIIIAGDSVGAGYIGEAALTQTAFFQHPVIGNAYKTGDMGYCEAGYWHFMGRKDQQIKIRGVRIEPDEIRHCFNQLDGVDDSLVLVNADNQLIAYLISAQKQIPSWREHISARLPAVMVPTAVLCLSAFPLSTNGKIDRTRLPEIQAETKTIIAPTTTLQTKLLAIWQAVLGIDNISIDDNFFALGGHSLLAANLVSRIRQQISQTMTIEQLFDYPSIIALADRLENSASAYHQETLLPADRNLYDNRFPLSLAQERLWLLEQIQGPSSMYNMPLAFTITGTIDQSLLQQAFRHIANRHQSLYTVLSEVDGTVSQQIDVTLPLLDIAEAETQIGLQEQVLQYVQMPFQVHGGALFRARLLTTCDNNQQDAILLIVMHHLISDGLSMAIFTQELFEAYGAPEHSDTKHLQYIDYSLHQRQHLDSLALSKQLQYWRQQLKDLPLLQLPVDYGYQPKANVEGALHLVEIPADLSQHLVRYAQTQQVSVSMLLLAAFKLLLCRYSHQADIIVGTASANRPNPALERMVGFFINTLAIRSNIDLTQPFTQHLKAVRSTLLTALANQDIPFEQVLDTLDLPRDLSHSPVFQAFYSYQAQPRQSVTAVSMNGISIDSLPLDESLLLTHAKCELSLSVLHLQGEDDSISLSFEYRTALFKPATIDRFGQHFIGLLDRIIQNPSCTMAEMAFLTPAERWQQSVNTQQHAEAPAFVDALFTSSRQGIAVHDADQALSYPALMQQVHKLAAYLIQKKGGAHKAHKNVDKNTRIALLLPPGKDFIIALLAVIRAGGCYIPLDISLPPARRNGIIADAQCQWIISDSQHLDDLAEDKLIDMHQALLADNHRADDTEKQIKPNITPETPLYMIYTSGSTGKPKGVEILHRGENNLLHWYTNTFNWHKKPERFLIISALGFDLTQKNLFAPLITGGELHFPKPGGFDPVHYCDLIQSRQIQVINCAPSAFYALLDVTAHNNHAALASLTQVFLGGERIDNQRVRYFFTDAHPQCQLVNMYGPTECTDIATWHRVSAQDFEQPLPIGTAIDGIDLQVLDQHQQPLPIGAIGELCIGGHGLAKGYWQQQALTQAAFIHHKASNKRLYRTGDLVSYNDQGQLRFHGRADHQIKLRGFRIEPFDIEQALCALKGIDQALVKAITPENDNTERLIAYVVALTDNQDAITTESVRRQLRTVLADYMLPEQVIVLAAMPLNHNGKIDLKALPKPTFTPSDRPCVAARNPIEMQLLAIWQQVLQQGTISTTETFFERGGHSLKAAQLAARIRQGFNIDINLRELFQYDTIQQQAAFIAKKRAQPRQIPALTKAPSGTKPQLSHAQQRLWLLTQMAPANSAYNMPAAWRITGHIDQTALANALLTLLTRHDSLRTVFHTQDGEPEIRVLSIDESPIRLQFSRSDSDACAQAIANDLAVEPFQLDSGELLRVRLISIHTTRHLLLINMHHIISDGQSVQILLKELLASYISHSQSTPLPLPAPYIQYTDYAIWQRQWLQGEVLQAEIDYWQQTLDGVTPLLPLPLDAPRPDIQDFRGKACHRELDTALAEAIKTRAQTEGLTPFMLMLSCYQLLLKKFCQHDDIAVGIPLSGRAIEGLDNVIGFFINALVIRTDLSTNASLQALMQQVKGQVLSAFAHEHVPIEMLLSALNIERNLAYTPVVQCAFNLISVAASENNLPTAIEGLRIEPVHQDTVVAKFDLQLNVLDSSDGLRISLDYNQTIFTEATIEQFLQHYISLLRIFCEQPDQRIDAILLATPEQGKTTLPLTAMQRDIYLASLSRPDTTENSLGYAWHLPIVVDAEHWFNSVRQIHQQFASLHARVVKGKGAWQEVAYLAIDPEQPMDYHLIDLSDQTMDQTMDAHHIQARLKQAVVKPYTLHEPLVSYRLFKLAENEYWFTFACHHLVSDGFSGVVHLNWMIAHYESRVKGTPIPRLEIDHYTDYPGINRQQFDTPETLLFWQEQLRQCQPLTLAMPAQEGTGSDQLRSEPVPDEQVKAIKAFCRQRRITPALYFKSLYALLIKLYTQVEGDFVITEFNAGRDKHHKDSIGCFYHNQPFLFTQSALTSSIDDLLAAAKQQQKTSRAYLHVSNLKLKQFLPESAIGFSYNYLMMPHSYTMLGQDFYGNRYTPNAEGMVDFRVQADGDELVLWLAFNDSAFSDNQFLKRLLSLSQQCLQGTDHCDALDYRLPAEQTRQAPLMANDKPLIHERFRTQRMQSPTAIALHDGQNSMSYQAVDHATHEMAQYLLSLGVTPSQSVAICLGASMDWVIAVWAVIKTGACYIPLDHCQPKARIGNLLADSEARWVIADADTLDMPDNCQRVDRHKATLANASASASASANDNNSNNDSDNAKTLNPKLKGTDHFYTLYTSGSTGKPKGATVTQANEANLIDWYIKQYQIQPTDNVLLLSSAGFDLTQKNLIAPLCAGAQLVINTDTTIDANRIIDSIEQHGISIINCAPAMLYALLETRTGASVISRHLRVILLGGETIQLQRLKPLAEQPDFKADIINMYGPTECTDIATAHRMSSNQLAQLSAQQNPGPLPLGQAISGVNLYVLNKQRQRVPNGIIGELAIAGHSVGAGYWQRPALNQQAFIQNPFSTNEHDQTLYLTGDWVYRDAQQPSAPLVYVGRKDFQVKINGKRIETGEIEAAIQSLDGVTDCRVLVNDNQLVAFVLCSSTATASDALANWREHLQHQLPDFMLPKRLHSLQAFPLNSNGKVDRQKLIDQDKRTPQLLDKHPVTATEKALTQIWHDVLGHRVSITENFFTAGGDSLAAVKLVARIDAHFSIKLQVASLFNAQTISQQAQLIEQQDCDFSPLVCLNAGQPEQTPVVAIHALGGMVMSYQPLAEALGKDCPFYALQAYGFDEGQTAYTDLDAMVEYYCKAIRAQHTGPCRLLGHSFGGIIALEVARRLQQQGQIVCDLHLLDTHQPLRYFSIPVDDAYILKTFVEHNFGSFDVPLSILRTMTADKMITRVVESLNGAVTEHFIRSAIAVIRGFQTMMTGYSAKPLDIPLHLYRPAAASQRWVGKVKKGLFKEKAETLGWHKISPSFHLHKIEGDHFTMLSEHGLQVASVIMEGDYDV